MIANYFLPLLSVIALCVFWAIFQVWLSKHDPDAKTKSAKCGGCGRRDECGGGAENRQEAIRQQEPPVPHTQNTR
jgi:hypothetical protein